MLTRKKSLASAVGLTLAGAALGAFVALPAMAEQPSHGFHHPPGTHKPHKPHPAPNPAPPPPAAHKPHKPHPVPNPPPSGHKPHTPHKPHPSLNPFAPGQ